MVDITLLHRTLNETHATLAVIFNGLHRGDMTRNDLLESLGVIDEILLDLCEYTHKVQIVEEKQKELETLQKTLGNLLEESFEDFDYMDEEERLMYDTRFMSEEEAEEYKAMRNMSPEDYEKAYPNG